MKRGFKNSRFFNTYTLHFQSPKLTQIMKALSILGSLLLSLSFSNLAIAQWRVIALKSDTKIYADGKLLKKGAQIKPSTQLKFAQEKSYVRVYQKRNPLFTIAPGTSKKLEGKAADLLLNRKKFFSRGEIKLIEPFYTLAEARDLLSGDLSLIFIDKAQLFFNKNVFQNYDQPEAFFLLYTHQGKKAVKKLSYQRTDDQITLPLDKNIYAGISDLNTISQNALFFKTNKTRKPTLLSRMKTVVVVKPDKKFKKEMAELIKILDREYTEKAIKKRAKTQNSSLRFMIDRADEYKLYDIIHFFLDYYDSMPERNSVKFWLIKNFPKLQVPGKQN
ncbi:hypothetical protein BKI52_13560 [marine bacterium AO1-C]|nr:hypothetical protein BKI52_13560 [marine bacterium AO1-C]